MDNRALPAPGADGIAAAFHEEVRRLGLNGLDVYFLAFLRRFSRFGYFTCGPVTIDVRMIEDIVERTGTPVPADSGAFPKLPEDVARFSYVLSEELRRSGRKRIDELHYLLAFMRCGEGLPARVFGELGVTPEQVEASMRAGGDGAAGPEKLYSPEEVATYLGVHVQTVRGWIRSGRLPASRLAGQRALRVRASDLAAVLEPVDPSDFE